MAGSSNLLLGALAIGVVTGMRSMLAPTMTSRALAACPDIRDADQPARTLASPRTFRLLMPLAASEIMGDKLPFAPDRTIKASMAMRILSGGVSAAALAGARRQPILFPALIGAAAAFVSAKVAFDLRKRHGNSVLTNAGLGLAEDVIGLAIGNAGLAYALASQSSRAS